jgi:hypothetical protein
MKRRCTPHVVKRIHKKTRSWRKAADHLNQLYGVSLSHATWRDYAAGKHDIADEETRALLLLGPRPALLVAIGQGNVDGSSESEFRNLDIQLSKRSALQMI